MLRLDRLGNRLQFHIRTHADPAALIAAPQAACHGLLLQNFHLVALVQLADGSAIRLVADSEGISLNNRAVGLLHRHRRLGFNGRINRLDGLRHGFQFHIRAHADPAALIAAPQTAGHGLLLQDLDLVALVQLADGSAIRLVADSEGIGLNNRAVGFFHSHGRLGLGFDCHLLVIGVLQADPSAIKFAPKEFSYLLGLANGKLVSFFGNTDFGIIRTGALAKVHRIAGDRNRHLALHFLQRFFVCSIFQRQPALVAFAPKIAVRCFRLGNGDLVTLIQIADHIIVQAGALADVHMGIGHIHRDRSGH